MWKWMKYLTYAWSLYQGWRRGESRVAPREVRGRVWVKKEVLPPGMLAKALGKPVIKARIQRAVSDEWEDLGTVSKGD